MKYIRPDTLKEALDFLGEHGKETQVIAGGTDIMPDLRKGALSCKSFLLDVSRLEDLKGIFFDGQKISIGAGVTLTEINRSGVIAAHAPALYKCSHVFAARQVRNKATIGGNVANASPCGDTVPPLIIHDACCLVADAREERLVPVREIAFGPYQCALPPDALIVRFILEPCRAGFADFQKIGRRRELATARMSLAVMADLDEDRRVKFIRIGLGACTPTPHNMTAVEEFLLSKPLDMKRIWEAGRLLSQKMIEITGRRSSSIYKEPAVQGLLTRILYPLVS
jgi:CO/xanthine dehydrogenase FAD-binding subunit